MSILKTMKTLLATLAMMPTGAVTSGDVATPPACNTLLTYPTRFEDSRVMVET
jgi:hypothetical protein